MVHLFMGVLGSGLGAWASGLHDTLRAHVCACESPQAWDSLCLPGVDGSEQGRVFLGSAGGRARKARSGGVEFGLLHTPQRPQGLRGLSSVFLEGQGSRNSQPDNRLILKIRWELALSLASGHLGVTLEGTLERTLGCWT